MATLTLKFDHEMNTSLQVHDDVYSHKQDAFMLGQSNPVPSGYDVQTSDITYLGYIVSIIQNSTIGFTLVINTASNIVAPSFNSFILFSKDNTVNMASPLGYYAQAKFVNDSHVKSELFATSCETFVSSK